MGQWARWSEQDIDRDELLSVGTLELPHRVGPILLR